MFTQKHFTLHIIIVIIIIIFLNTHNFEVWALNPRDLKNHFSWQTQVLKEKKSCFEIDTGSPISKKLFLFTNISLEAEKEESEKAASKCRKAKWEKKSNSSLLILKLSTGKVSSL